MASSGSSSPPAKRQRTSSDGPFVFGLFNSLDRLKQLVNNEYLSDVMFKVGSTGQLVYAHKILLTLASEVFFTQFNNGNFAESSGSGGNQGSPAPVVTIEDIQPEMFLQLMHYIYCDEMELTAKNVLEVYYAAQKYMLHQLTDRCRHFFATEITEGNVLSILDGNQQHKFTAVDEKCLVIIRDNPLWFFKLEQFSSCSRRTLELIAASRTMNCHKQHLQDAIDQWAKKNDISASADIIPSWEGMQCSKLDSHSTTRYGPFINTDLSISVEGVFKIYGIGVFVGQKGTSISKSVTYTIQIWGAFPGGKFSVRVPIENKPYIREILFGKHTFKSHAQIQIEVHKQHDVHMLRADGFEPADKLPSDFKRVTSRGSNCVAYILYGK